MRVMTISGLRALISDQEAWEGGLTSELLERVAEGLSRPQLAAQLRGLWAELDESKRMDLIEMLDELSKRERLEGLGERLERSLKRS